MTLKRALLIAVVGVVVAVGVANAGWFYQAGRWFYTPDIGTEITYKGVPVPGGTDNPPKVVWTLTTTHFGCACWNNGGNLASETVSVKEVTLTAVDPLNPEDFLDKKKGIALAQGHFDTDGGLCTPANIQCQNPNWTLVHPPNDVDRSLVYSFTGTAEAHAYDKKLGTYVAVPDSKKIYACTLSDPNATPLNLPAPGTPYNCDELEQLP